jgi:tetraacyldisaccharide 4'-kinase
VGNIYLGGTGKTPASILLAKELSKIGKRATIIRKYYEDHEDEYNLIKNNFSHLIVKKNRIDCLNEAEVSGTNVVIMDDGLQDYHIKKDLKIVCFNASQLIGNGLILPSGPLRESLSALKDANIVLINGEKNKIFEKKLFDINKKLEIFYSKYKPMNLHEFKGKKLFAIAGIGNPENFFKLIEKNNLKVFKKLIFPDHYKFSSDEIKKIEIDAQMNDYKIIMTEKDFFKINNFTSSKISYLKVSLIIENQEKLISLIKNKI